MIPQFNSIARYLLIRYKERLLRLPYSDRASRIIECIDLFFEAEAEARRG